MCGIAGLIGWSGTDNEIKDIKDKIQLLSRIEVDSKGHWSSQNKNSFFSYQIIDS